MKELNAYIALNIIIIILLVAANIYAIIRRIKINNAILRIPIIEQDIRENKFLTDEIDNKIMELKIQKEEELELLKEINENLKEINQKLNS